MAHASFDGLRVLSLESRRAVEVAKLIRTYGGEPIVVPAMREVSLAIQSPGPGVRRRPPGKESRSGYFPHRRRCACFARHCADQT